MQTNQTKSNKLKRLVLCTEFLEDYKEEANLYTCYVYSYMLCKYSWFKSKNQSFFESQDSIAESCNISVSVVKKAIRFLENKGFVKIGKIPSKDNNKNVYVVEDKYGMYNYTKKASVEEEDDWEEPF